jgi:hypothetical protein
MSRTTSPLNVPAIVDFPSGSEKLNALVRGLSLRLNQELIRSEWP